MSRSLVHRIALWLLVTMAAVALHGTSLQWLGARADRADSLGWLAVCTAQGMRWVQIGGASAGPAAVVGAVGDRVGQGDAAAGAQADAGPGAEARSLAGLVPGPADPQEPMDGAAADAQCPLCRLIAMPVLHLERSDLAFAPPSASAHRAPPVLGPLTIEPPSWWLEPSRGPPAAA